MFQSKNQPNASFLHQMEIDPNKISSYVKFVIWKLEIENVSLISFFHLAVLLLLLLFLISTSLDTTNVKL